MSVRGVRHTGIVVTRLAPAVSFWTSLGFKVKSRAVETGRFIDGVVGLKNSKVAWAKLTAPDGGMIELLEYRSHPALARGRRPANRVGVHHVAMTVRGVDALVHRLARKGFKANAAPAVSPDGKVKVVYVHGPDELVLELVEVL